MDIPETGVILVDPRTSEGKAFLRGDASNRWPVVPYTYLRACILESELLDTADFKRIVPIFEHDVGGLPRAIRLHMHPRLLDSMSAAELDELKLRIAVSHPVFRRLIPDFTRFSYRNTAATQDWTKEKLKS